MRYQEAGGYQYEDGYQERSDVEDDDDGDVEFHGRRVYIVAGGVEVDETRLLLQHHQADAYDVANEQSLTDDEGCKP